MFVAFLILSDVPPTTVDPILLHGDNIWLVHIHLYRVPFILCWTWIYVLDEKVIIPVSILFLSCVTALWSPCLIIFGFIRVTDSTYSCSWTSGIRSSLLPLSIDTSSQESLPRYKSGHKYDICLYAYFLSSAVVWHVPLMITTRHFSRWLFTNGPAIVKILVSALSTCLWRTKVDGIFSILDDHNPHKKTNDEANMTLV